MDKLLIKNARVYQDGQFARADVLCEDALIAKIGENLTDDDARIIDAGGMRLAPGFIDVHTHGAAGVDVNAADEAGLRRIAAFFATQGVTAFNASVLTDTPETTEKCLGAIANVMSDRGKGPQLFVEERAPVLLAQDIAEGLEVGCVAHLLEEVPQLGMLLGQLGHLLRNVRIGSLQILLVEIAVELQRRIERPQYAVIVDDILAPGLGEI